MTLSVVFLIILTMANTVQSQTTSFAYDFDNGLLPIGLIYERDTHLTPHSLRLTKTDDDNNALQDSVGRVRYGTRLPFWDSGKVSDFETTIKFIIKPNPNDPDPADGISFFIAPVVTALLPVYGGGNLGLFRSDGSAPAVFVVEFDIYVNEWDPPYGHVGIDIESRKSAAHTQISDDLVGKEVTMRVNYVGATKMIRVVVTSGAQSYEVSYEYDLTTVLQKEIWVGIAAATGGKVATYDVVSWYFTSTMYQTLVNGNSINRQIMWN